MSKGTFHLEIQMDRLPMDRIDLGEVLQKCSGEVERGKKGGSIRDAEGNMVGCYWFESPEGLLARYKAIGTEGDGEAK